MGIQSQQRNPIHGRRPRGDLFAPLGGTRRMRGRIGITSRIVAAVGMIAATVVIVPATLAGASSTASASLDQCANGGVGTTPQACSGSNWVNGNVNGQKAHWSEGEFVSYRSILGNLPAGTWTLQFGFKTTDGGKHAFDYVGSYDATETTSPTPTQFHANNSNVCSGVTLAAGSCTSPLTVAAPTNTNFTGQAAASCGATGTWTNTPTQVPGTIDLFGAPGGSTLDSAVYNTQNVPSGGGCDTTVNVTFTLAAGLTGSQQVILAWGGHIASELDWGQGNAATSINGSPYHMFLNQISTGGVITTIGSQDRALSASAIVFQPTLATVVVPSTVTVGSPVHDTATLTNANATAGGTVTYKLYQGACSTGTLVSTSTGAVTNGLVANSATFTPTTAGSYCYLASYSGDAQDAASTAPAEPFTVSPANPAISTTVKTSGGATVTNSAPAPLGSSVQDTATMTGTATGAGGTVTYSFFTNNACTAPAAATSTVTVTNGSVPASATMSNLGAGGYSFQASYSGDTNNSPASGSCEPFKISKATLAPATVVFSASTNTAWTTGVTGAKAYDTATLTPVGSFTPTGTVSYVFFTNGTCTSPPDTTFGTSTVTIAGGSVPQSATTAALGGGSYSFLATYNSASDPNYSGVAGSCEPFSIGRVSTTTSTTVENPDGSPVTAALPLGSTVKDSATVTPVGGLQSGLGAPTGSVKFVLYSGVTSPTNCSTGSQIATSTTSLSAGSATWTPGGQPLGAGSYGFVATYLDDSSYIGSVGSCEPFTISQASSQASTVVYDATGVTAVPWDLTNGELAPAAAYDTTSVLPGSGTLPAAPGPTGNVIYQLFNNGTCQAPAATTSGPVALGTRSPTASGLAAGSYSYLATYQGDSNYKGIAAACEPFTVTAPAVTALKTVSDVGPVPTGTTLTYTITLTNSGDGASSPMTVTDTIPVGTTYLSGGTAVGSNPVTSVQLAVPALAPGGSTFVQFKVTVNAADKDGQIIPNTAIYANQGGCTPSTQQTCSTNTVDTTVGVPTISVTKQDTQPGDDVSVVAGQSAPIKYTLVVANSGLLPSGPVVVNDPIPAGSTYVPGSANPTPSQITSSALTWDLSSVPATGVTGNPIFITFEVSVNGSDQNGTSINNTATFTNVNSCTQPTNGMCSTNTVSNPVLAPIVAAVKTSNPTSGSTVAAGSNVTFTISLTNSGGAQANETVTDAVPAGMTFVSAANGGTQAGGTVTWTNVAVPAGATAAVSFVAQVNPGDANGSTVSNFAVFNNNNTPGCAAAATCDTNTVTLTVIKPIIAAVKANDPTGAVTAGQSTITYTIAVTNSGSQASGPVTVTDVVPSGSTYVANSAKPSTEANYDAATNTITWTIPTVPAASGTKPGEVDVTFQVSVNATDQNGSSIVNQASFTNINSGCGSAATCPTNTVTNPVLAPIVAASKSSVPASGSTVAAGSNVTFTISLTNAGGAPATETVTDAVPAGMTFVSAANGGTQAGGTVTWTNVPVPANTTATSPVTVSFVAQVNPGDANGSTVSNFAVFNNHNTPGCSTATTCDTNTVTLTVIKPIITVQKVNNPTGTVTAGQTVPITYTLKVLNSGDQAATNVIVADTIPVGATYVPGSAAGPNGTNAGFTSGKVSWMVPTVPPEVDGTPGEVDLTFKVSVPATDADGSTITNQAVFTNVNTPVTSCIANPADTSGATCLTNQVVNPVVAPVISASKSSNPPSTSAVLPGETITYSVTVHNTGGAGGPVTVNDAPPVNTTLVDGSPACDPSVPCTTSVGTASVLTWKFNLAAHSSATVTFQVTVNPSAPSCSAITNTAAVNGTPTNSTVQSTIFAVLGLVLTAVPAPMASDGTGGLVSHGQTINYTLTWSNTGKADAIQGTVTDVVPAGATYVAGSADNAGSLVTNTVTWTGLSFPAGKSGKLNFQVTVNNDDPDGFHIVNVAKASAESLLPPGITVPTGCPTLTAATSDLQAAGVPSGGVHAAAVTAPAGTLAYNITSNQTVHVVSVPPPPPIQQGTAPQVAPSTTTTTIPVVHHPLAFTGMNARGLAIAAMALVLSGGVIVLLGRSRRGSHFQK